ncbi:hypothetical protein N7475_010013 [Penicillium sp. IBT 31633x]|nr:hypothetical protein N7475_010013 [Penicillium sp. IBT 31633x]
MDMHPDDDEAWRHDLNLFESDKSATRRPGDFGVLGLGDPGKPLKGEEKWEKWESERCTLAAKE